MRLVLGTWLTTLFVLAAGSAGAGIVVTMEMNDSGEKPKVNTMFIEQDRLKMTGAHADIIYRADLGKVWILNAQDHAYREMTPESMKQIRSQMDGVMAQMQERLKSMPEAQRKQMEAMMAQRGMGAPGAKAAPAAVTYEKVGGTKTVGKWSCTPYEMRVGGEDRDQLCIARLSDVGITRDDLKAFASFGTFMRNMMPGGQGKDGTGAYDFDGLSKAIGYDGLPVQTSHGADGQDKVESTVKDVERKSIPADMFDLPAGYKKQEMPTMGGSRAGPPPQDGD